MGRSSSGEPLSRSFYARDAVVVARELIGCVLVRRVGRRVMRARIVETEAYVGEHDLACHAAKGRTARTEVMFGKAGVAYVYFIYGVHDMLNIVCAAEGEAQAVLIRGAEALDGWEADLSGPGKLTRAMGITVKGDNKRDVTRGSLVIFPAERRARRVVRTKRIGVDYAKHWKDRLLRFIEVEKVEGKGRRMKAEG